MHCNSSQASASRFLSPSLVALYRDELRKTPDAESQVLKKHLSDTGIAHSAGKALFQRWKNCQVCFFYSCAFFW